MNLCLDYLSNITQSYNKKNEILSLYNLYSGINYEYPSQSIVINTEPKISFHVLYESTVRQKYCVCNHCIYKLSILIKSYLATQNLNKTELIIWTNAETHDLLATHPFLVEYYKYVRLKVYTMKELAKTTPLENESLINITDERHYLQGDLFRYLVLYQYGGIYVDADSIFLNDFFPTLQGVFWTRWACTEYISGGVMYFYRHSKILVEIMKLLLRTSINPDMNSYAWGRNLLTQYINIQENKIKQLKIYLHSDKDMNKQIQIQKEILEIEVLIPNLLPACFFYPEWCSEGFHSYFDEHSANEIYSLDLYLNGFIYHWHSSGGIGFEKTIKKYSKYDVTRLLVEKLMLIKYDYKSQINFNPYIDEFICYPYLFSIKYYHYYYVKYVVIGVIILAILLKYQSRRTKTHFQFIHKEIILLRYEFYNIFNIIYYFLNRTRLFPLFFCLASLLAVIMISIRYTKKSDCSFAAGGEYSIGLYKIRNNEINKNIENPILTRSHVTDRIAKFIADPFHIEVNGNDYLFFEVQSNNGDIGMARKNKVTEQYEYQRIVLDEPFHLSYPYVFTANYHIYMIPETHQVNAVILYIAVNFPYIWTPASILLSGKEYADASIVEYEHYYYIFVSIGENNYASTELYYSNQVTGPYIEHPSSPIRFDLALSRSAGRIILSNVIYNQIFRAIDCLVYRFVMNNLQEYGHSVSTLCVTSLSTSIYADRVLNRILKGTGNKSEWNGNNMHHIDVFGNDIVVDGCGQMIKGTERASPHNH